MLTNIKVLVYFILLILSCSCHLQSKKVVQHQVQNVVSNVVQKYFADGSSLGVFLTEDKLDYTTTDITKPIMIFSEEVTSLCTNKLMDSGGYIFVVPNSLTLVDKIIPYLLCLNKTSLVMRTKKILIVCLNSDHCHEKDFYWNQLYEMWNKFGLVNVLILTIYTKDSKIVPVLSAYNPFMVNNMTKRGTIMILDSIENFNCKLEKRFLNMHGYTLRAVMFPFNISAHPLFFDKPNSIKGGADLTFKWTLEKHFNVSFEVSPSRDGTLHGFSINGTPNGALADVIHNHVDIALNAKLVKWYDSPRVQFLMPRFHGTLVVIVKKNNPIEGWKVILHVFRWQVWAWIVCTTSLTCLAAWLLAKVSSSKDVSGGREPLSGVWMVLKLTISMSVVQVPKSYHGRFLMTTCLWFSIVIVNLFFGQLFYLIKTKPRLANIDTLQELHDTGLPIFTTYQGFADAFDGLQNSPLRKLKERLKFKTFGNSKINQNSPNTISSDYALLYSNTLIEFQTVAESRDFIEQIHFLKEHVLEFHLAIYMPTGSIYYKHFNRFSMMIVEYGFPIKWMHEYLSFIKETNNRIKPMSTDMSVESNQFSLLDLVLPFIILILGLGISTIVFFLELYLNIL